MQALFGSEKDALEKIEYYYRAALMDITDRIKVLQADEMSQSRVYQKRYQELLKQQVEAAIAKLHGQEYEIIEQFAESSYTDGFVGTMYDLHGQGVPVITPIDRKAMVNAVLTDSKINERLYKELGQDLTTLKATIRREITRGVAANTTWSEIARNIREQSGIPMRRAKTIAQTEGHRVQEEASEDARTAAIKAGADVVKQWDATMDGKTRQSHQRLDGQVRETDEPFSNGLMYPGDSSGPASEVIKCRCHALTRSRRRMDEDELAALQKRAEFFGLDKSEDFEDFRKKYLKAAQTVDKSGKSGIITVGENYVSNKGFTIPKSKIDRFFLLEGAKHAQDFFNVGYTKKAGDQLARDIENAFDESNAVDIVTYEDGSERFSTFMDLGVSGKKRFRIVWLKDTKDSKPRLITGHRED